MRMRNTWCVAGSLILGLVILTGALIGTRTATGQPRTPAPVPPRAAEPTEQPVLVLDTRSVWRAYSVLRPPVVQLSTERKAVTSTNEWLERETAAAPSDWTQAEFADGTWVRGSAQGGARTSYAAELCLRARFEVTDLAQVQGLKLSVAYYGGLIAYVNGREIARGNLPTGAVGPATLADVYPLEAFVTDKGQIIPGGWQTSQYPAALAARERKLTDIAIPATALRKGTNVLALHALRAPYHKVLEEKSTDGKAQQDVKERNCPYDLNWSTCEVRQVKLTAGGAAGLVANAVRPKELQAWNGDLLTRDVATDWGDRCEPLRPVLIQGPQNGWSSGKVVLGAPQAITGLKVTCGNLQRGAAVIPAAAMRARYAVPFGDKTREDTPLDSLLETPLASFPVGVGGAAVVPIWLTVKIPAQTPAGEYTGQAKIEAAGQTALQVPVRLLVADYAVPDTQNYRTWMELMQSPDTLALEYDVPQWSDRHWEMIGESFRYMGEIGNRVVHIPLIAQSNSGNEQSMVRYTKKADGSYSYDFSIMDKYLDLAVRNMGKPKFVAFTVWEVYLKTPKEEVKITDKDGAYIAMEKSWDAARWELRGKGPAVTALDPATGNISTINLPRFEDPAAKAVWKPLFAELRKRMAQRGLEKAMLLGMASDDWASKDEMTVIQEVSGNLPWINHTHGGNHVGQLLYGLAPVAYTAYVWNNRYAVDPSKGRTYGWKRPELYVEFRRFSDLNNWPLASILLFGELQITGQQRGLGRIGADFWPVLKNKRGEPRRWVWGKYPQSLWHSCNLASHMLVPGPTGPMATDRYELMREGIQECEARIAIEMVLTDDARKAKLGAPLAQRCQQLLDERVMDELKAWSSLGLSGRNYATRPNPWYEGCGGPAGHAWYAASGWQDRTQRLYTLAGEVTRKLAEK